MISFKPIKRVLILILGGTVLAVGVALIVLPGPAFIVIPAGLAILAIEFAWARRWLQRLREGVRHARKGNAATDVPSPIAGREGRQ